MVATDVVVAAFSELASCYERTMDRELQTFWGLRYDGFISQLVDILPIAGSNAILDVATGTARIPVTVASRTEVTGVTIGLDITPAMLRRGLANVEASGLNPRIRLVCASALGMPFTAGFFDIVICGFATHHMDVPNLLPELKRVLKEGGWLVLVDVSAPSWWRASAASAIPRIAALSYGLTHWKSARLRAEMAALPNIRTATEWQALLSQCGFSEIEVVAEFPGRRLWYPAVLTLKATKQHR